MIGSQGCDFFANRTIFCSINHIFFSANENGTIKITYRITSLQPISLQENERQRSRCLENLSIKLCDFKMDLIKWLLNFGSCNFGLKSYLWFQNRTSAHFTRTPLGSITILNRMTLKPGSHFSPTYLPRSSVICSSGFPPHLRWIADVLKFFAKCKSTRFATISSVSHTLVPR